MAVYMFHFFIKVGRAGHYTGAADDLETRFDEHANTTWVPYSEPSYAEGKKRLGEKHGKGATLMGVVNSRNIPYVLARVWQDKSFAFEKMLKTKIKNAPWLCPICTPGAEQHLKG